MEDIGIIEKVVRDYLENSNEPWVVALRKHATQSPAVLNPLEDWADGHDVTKLLRIGSRTLHDLRRDGILPYSRLGRKFFYKQSDIQRILNDNYTMYKLRNKNKSG